MDWNVTVKNVGILGIFSLLLVFAVGPALTTPLNRSPAAAVGKIDPATQSTATTVEVFKNVQKILHATKPLGGKRKWVKQEEAAGTVGDGSANALAYLTDSFGGQIAGQILSLIIASVTGDVRGILGGSLNLFQDDDRRDRVQVFLDDISKNFLQFTGLGLLTTTRSPLQQPTLYPGAPVLLGGGQGQGLQSFPASSGGAAAFAPASAAPSGGIFATAAQTAILNHSQQSQQQPQQQQPAAQQQPIIYVLPNLENGGTSDTGALGGTKTNTGSKVTSNSGDDDSEEDRK